MCHSRNAHTNLAKEVGKNPQHESLPTDSIDYYKQFVRIDDYLNKHIHPQVNVGPTACEPIWLTDHGPEHVATVIRRAGDLVFIDECVLTPYEAYILLLAAHFHDIGNIFGRDEHTQKIRQVMFKLDKTLVGDNNLEKRMICDIAMAHGGYVREEGGKDTIGKLPWDDPPDRSNSAARVKKLAAILRLADELSDDNTRTSRFVQEASKEVLPGSEIFHGYASQLRPVIVSHDTRSIDVRFELNTELINKKLRKGTDEKYLYDEILDRTCKMYREYIYCNRFMLPDIVLQRINVHIDVCTDNYSDILGTIKYTMAEEGYPGRPRKIQDLSPEVVAGDVIKQRVESVLQSNGNSPYTEPANLLVPIEE